LSVAAEFCYHITIVWCHRYLVVHTVAYLLSYLAMHTKTFHLST